MNLTGSIVIFETFYRYWNNFVIINSLRHVFGVKSDDSSGSNKESITVFVAPELLLSRIYSCSFFLRFCSKCAVQRHWAPFAHCALF